MQEIYIKKPWPTQDTSIVAGVGTKCESPIWTPRWIPSVLDPFLDPLLDHLFTQKISFSQ